MTSQATSQSLCYDHIEQNTLLIDIATRNVVTLTPGDTIGEAARIMAGKRISSIVVMEETRHPAGIVTERNMLHAMQSGCEPETALLKMMSSPVIAVPASMSCLDAYQICLRDGIRHLVIVDDDKMLLGVVSETDFRLHMNLSALAGRRQVTSVMSRSVSVVHQDDSLQDALNLMQSHRDSCVTVVDADRPVGIVTERDIVRLYSGNAKQSDIRIREVMTSPVLTISLDNTINEAAEQMLTARVRHLVVVDQAGRMAGLISEHDLSHNLAHSLIDDRLKTEGLLLHTLMKNIPDMVWLKDVNGVYLTCNSRFERFIGLKEKEIIGKTDFDLVDHAIAESFRQSDRKAMENGGATLVEESVTYADDGHREFLETIKTPMRDRHGNLIGVLGIARDITARKRTEQQLADRENLFHAIFDQVPCGIELIDPESLRFIEANPAACGMLGYTHEEFLKLNLTDTQAQMNREVLAAAVKQMSLSGSATFENQHRSKDGAILDVEINARMLDMAGRRLLVGVWRDITEHKRAEENLRIIASVFDNSQEAIVITDADNTIIDVNAAFSHITGYSREEALGRNPRMLSSGRQDKEFYSALWQSLAQKKVWRGEIWNRRKSGEIYAGLLSIAGICDDQNRVLRYVGVFSDISTLKAHEAELSRIAHYDMLTGVPNRLLLVDRLSQAMLRVKRGGNMLAVCYMDLDGFKQVNDQYGHEVGDKLLVDVTQRLQEVLRAEDTLARLGGDEFVLLFNDLANEQECFQVLNRILDNISTPVFLGPHRVSVSASMGVTFYPADNEDGDTLLRHADQAMYVAKQTGKNRYHQFDSEYDHRLRTLHDTRRRILQGLEDDEFELFYQPKTELISGRIIGAEALIRWHHPQRGLLLPAQFLPAIEDSDIEIQLGEWVMDAALSQLDRWRESGFELEVSINISARHLQSPDFVFGLERKLLQYPQLLPGSLQIEVLETAALADIFKSSETIESCRKLGVSFALDDFGTGYSSLTYLRKLSADTLKIDQSFVREMLLNEGDYAIVQGIVALATTFGRKTVAEGVELPDHIDELIKIGCMYGQGYGIAYPMQTEDFMKWYRQ